MQRIDWAKFAAALTMACASGACAASGAGAPPATTNRGSIAITTVAFPSPGVQVTEVSIPMDLPTYYAQHGIALPVPGTGAAAVSGLGPPPSVPPPPGPGDVRPDVGRVIEIVEQNGWTSTTTYTRDVRPNPGGGYTDGPWEYGGNITQPSSGAGGGCTGKTSPDGTPCASPF